MNFFDERRRALLEIAGPPSLDASARQPSCREALLAEALAKASGGRGEFSSNPAMSISYLYKLANLNPY